MRRVASMCWLLLVGCNRIFGITETQPWDAPPDVVPDLPHVALTWQLATTSPTGGPSAVLEYPPFAPAAAPQVRVATIDGAFTPASYSSDATTPGWIVVPRSYFEPPAGETAVQPWRLEYTLPGGVPHEVQWTPDDKIGHLVVPMVGRVDRPPVPDGSGYQLTVNGFTFPTTGPVHNPSVLTTGLWTAGPTAAPSGASVDYAFVNASSLSGARGSPSTTPSDRGFLVDYVNTPDGGNVRCNVAVGSASLSSLALTAGTHSAQTIKWDASRRPVVSELPDLITESRLITALGKLNNGVSDTESWFFFGSIPSINFPGLIASAPGIQLPVPVMQVLLQCPQGPGSAGPTVAGAIPNTAQPTLLADFFTAVHVQLVEARPVTALGSVTLFSGMETVIAAPAGGGFRLSFPAAIPTQITLTTPAGTALDLAGDSDQIPTGPLSGQFTLDFVPETGVGLRADYHDVYLHRISAGALVTPPERIYTVTAPEVKIDASQLAAGADYVFEIRSYAGHVSAPHGDFTPVDYPYGSAVVFTRTVRTP